MLNGSYSTRESVVKLHYKLFVASVYDLAITFSNNSGVLDFTAVAVGLKNKFPYRTVESIWLWFIIQRDRFNDLVCLCK